MTRPDVYRVLVQGQFSRDQVRVSWQRAPLSLPSELQDAIDCFWDGIRSQRHVYDGAVCRLDRWHALQDHLHLALRPGNYRTLLFSNQYSRAVLEQWGKDYLSNALGISAILISRDQRILLMRRSADVGEFPNCLDVFGGHIDAPNDGEIPDVFDAMLQELQEEVGLDPESVALTCLGMIESTVNLKPELVFSARVPWDEADLRIMTQTATDRAEYTQVVSWPHRKAEIRRNLQRYGKEFSPSAFGSLDLYLQSIEFLKMNRKEVISQ